MLNIKDEITNNCEVKASVDEDSLSEAGIVEEQKLKEQEKEIEKMTLNRISIDLNQEIAYTTIVALNDYCDLTQPQMVIRLQADKLANKIAETFDLLSDSGGYSYRKSSDDGRMEEITLSLDEGDLLRRALFVSFYVDCSDEGIGEDSDEKRALFYQLCDQLGIDGRSELESTPKIEAALGSAIGGDDR